MKAQSPGIMKFRGFGCGCSSTASTAEGPANDHQGSYLTLVCAQCLDESTPKAPNYTFIHYIHILERF